MKTSRVPIARLYNLEGHQEKFWKPFWKRRIPKGRISKETGDSRVFFMKLLLFVLAACLGDCVRASYAPPALRASSVPRSRRVTAFEPARCADGLGSSADLSCSRLPAASADAGAWAALSPVASLSSHASPPAALQVAWWLEP